MSDRENFLESLRACYSFPCFYSFKLIGDAGPELLADAQKTWKNFLPDAKTKVHSRPSKKGNHQSLTVDIEVPNPEIVYDLYAAFRALDRVKMML